MRAFASARGDFALVDFLLELLVQRMNPIPMLRGILGAHPFRPFLLCLSDGRKLPVKHPDYLLISPNGRIIWEGDTEEKFAMAMPFHVTGVEHIQRRRKHAA